jgi:hypothetical protein
LIWEKENQEIETEMDYKANKSDKSWLATDIQTGENNND